MFRYHVKMKDFFRKKYDPKDIYDANFPILHLLSNMGLFSFKIVQENGRKQIVIDKKRKFIPCLNLMVLAYLFIDFCINRVKLSDKPIMNENIYYTIILLQLFCQISTLIILFLFNNKFLVSIQKFYNHILDIDGSIDKLQTRNNLKVLLKYNIIMLCFGFMHSGILAVYYTKISIKLWFAYFIPFFYIAVMTYYYTITIYILRIRFRSLNQIILKNIIQKLNSPFPSNHSQIINISANESIPNCKLDIHFATSVHDKLCDLVEDVNATFGIPISACIFSLFVFIVVHVFTRVIYLTYTENYKYYLNFYFGSSWNLLCQLMIFQLLRECEICNIEVSF